MLFPMGSIESRDSKRHVEPAESGCGCIVCSRTIEPQSASVVLKKDDHIQSVEFEVVQGPRPWRTILGAAVVGAIVGAALQRGRPNTSYLRRSGSSS